MATEKPQLPPTTDPGQQEAINSIFEESNIDYSKSEVTKSEGGITTYRDPSSGKSFAVVDSSAGEEGKLKLNQLPFGRPAVLNENVEGTVKGGKSDTSDTVLSVNNNDVDYDLKDGDDKVVVTGFGNNTFEMGEGNDTVYGGTGDDTITGDIGRDKLYGGAGSDSIDGGNGSDLIEGGEGNDKLTGGEGFDTFVFNNEATGSDTITDFSKDDILKIADRNGDGKVTEGGDYDIASDQDGNAVIWLKDADGNEDGKIKLKGFSETDLKTATKTDDGTFSFFETDI